MRPVIRLLASAPTITQIQAQINAFYYSTSWRVDPDTLAIVNDRGQSLPPSVRVIRRAGRYRFERVISLDALTA